MLIVHWRQAQKMTGHVTILELYCYHCVSWLPTGSKDLIHSPGVACTGFLHSSSGRRWRTSAGPDRRMLSPENVLHMLYNPIALFGDILEVSGKLIPVENRRSIC